MSARQVVTLSLTLLGVLCVMWGLSYGVDIVMVFVGTGEGQVRSPLQPAIGFALMALWCVGAGLYLVTWPDRVAAWLAPEGGPPLRPALGVAGIYLLIRGAARLVGLLWSVIDYPQWADWSLILSVLSVLLAPLTLLLGGKWLARLPDAVAVRWPNLHRRKQDDLT